VYIATISRKKTKSFLDADLEGVQVPHEDAMVIMPKVGDSIVQRVLVDMAVHVISFSFLPFSRWKST